LDGTGELLRLAGGTGMDTRLRGRFEVFGVDEPLPAGDALRSGGVVGYASRADRNTRWPRFEGYEGGAGTVLVAPMLTEDGSAVGVMSVGWEAEGQINPEAQELAVTVANLCGRTIVRARQYDRAQRTLSAQRTLAEASRLLDDLGDVDDTFRRLAALTVPDVVDVCVVCLLDDHGDLRPLGGG
jgi:GAF domain-containing protein